MLHVVYGRNIVHIVSKPVVLYSRGFGLKNNKENSGLSSFFFLLCFFILSNLILTFPLYNVMCISSVPVCAQIYTRIIVTNKARETEPRQKLEKMKSKPLALPVSGL